MKTDSPLLLWGRTPCSNLDDLLKQGKWTKSRLDYARKYKIPQDAANAIYAQMLLASCLEKYLGESVSLEEIEIQKTKKGQPYLPAFSDLYLSISHSSDYVAVAVARERIGIDIQQVRPVKDSLYKRTLSIKERDFLQQCQDPHREFALLWALKEAIVKKQGSGFDRSPREIDLGPCLSYVEGQLALLEEARYQGDRILCQKQEHLMIGICGPHERCRIKKS